MTIELKMPALSPTMETGTLARWLVGPGDAVAPGDVIAEIETDKATMEFESIEEGWVGALLVAAGTDDVAVGTPIATLTIERPDEVDDSAAAPTRSQASVLSPPSAGGGETAQAQPIAGAIPPEKATATSTPTMPADATPLAARYARARGIDLPDGRGRVRIGDLVASPAPVTPVSPGTRSAVAPTPTAAAAFEESGIDGIPHSRTRLSGMRRTIARRLTESKQQVPHIYLTVDIRLDALIALRVQLNEALAPRGIKLSVNDFAVKALGLALVAEPSCNVRYTPDALIRFERADVSVAVSVPDGLLTPVVVGADTRSLSAIATTMRDLAERARAGTLEPQAYAGGTASLSNLGMFGIDHFAAVLNPPQASILAIGTARRRPWEVGGEIGIATLMSVTGSFDHRAIDGADAARFLDTFRALMENPLDLTV